MAFFGVFKKSRQEKPANSGKFINPGNFSQRAQSSARQKPEVIVLDGLEIEKGLYEELSRRALHGGTSVYSVIRRIVKEKIEKTK